MIWRMPAEVGAPVHEVADGVGGPEVGGLAQGDQGRRATVDVADRLEATRHGVGTLMRLGLDRSWPGPSPPRREVRLPVELASYPLARDAAPKELDRLRLPFRMDRWTLIDRPRR